MKPQTHPLTLVLFVLSFFFTATLSAQQNLTVQMNGAKMRAPLEVLAGDNTITLCDLIPGNTYLLIGNGAAAGQEAEFEIAASASTLLPQKTLLFRKIEKMPCVSPPCRHVSNFR
ncbi:MAG: hypothetical protein IPJ82_12990 [Lewinellaceae bacterium]|nr:hypothetical protein [Lewinellaceae bacterium]